MTIRSILPAALLGVTLPALIALAGSPRAAAADWITAPSYYTHNPHTGRRVQQYQTIGPLYVYHQGSFQRSGFRHTRSSIQAGGSADHYHLTEEWGRPVRPYGEWRFPYRPNSVPYDLWGPPVVWNGFRPGFGPYGFGGRGPGGVPPVPPGTPPGTPTTPNTNYRIPYPGYRPQPWDDGRYAPYDSRGPYGYPDLQQPPTAPRDAVEN